jgi:hypothetical protein
MTDAFDKLGCSLCASSSPSNFLVDSVVTLAKVPYRLFTRIFGPLGHKVVCILNSFQEQLGIPTVQPSTLIASITGLTTLAATIVLIQRGFPYANLCHAKGLMHLAQGRLITSAAEIVGAASIVALAVSAIFFTSAGILKGVLFGMT